MFILQCVILCQDLDLACFQVFAIEEWSSRALQKMTLPADRAPEKTAASEGPKGIKPLKRRGA
jgi:hypothetical protein